ncbi:unnamed protein product [Durusdinium trenchii]|uniref:Secreted protein n=1 Tax=Durusdinium trenchii TaxID=1381693 RepID=A0ABP0JK36_9DINO
MCVAAVGLCPGRGVAQLGYHLLPRQVVGCGTPHLLDSFGRFRALQLQCIEHDGDLPLGFRSHVSRPFHACGEAALFREGRHS